MKTFKKALTIIGETFAAPTSGSYIIPTDHGDVVLREGGAYEGIDLSGARLAGVKLPKIKLHNAILKNADLSNAILEGADLTGADLSGATLSGTKLDGAMLTDIIKENVKVDAPPSGVSPDFFTK